MPIRFTRTTVSNGISWWGPRLETVRSAQPTPGAAHREAQPAEAPRRRASTAAFTSSSLVTSQ